MARSWSCAEVTCGHPGQAVLSAMLIMERQEVSPESDVECELCDKIQVWIVVAGVLPLWEHLISVVHYE